MVCSLKKKKMCEAIEMLIKHSFEDTGCHGEYNFRYTKVNVNQINQQCLSFFTMHHEKFVHIVETDLNIGKMKRL